MSTEDAYKQFYETATQYARSNDSTGRRRSAEAATALRQQFLTMAEETVSATDPQGYVEATVRLSGELVDVRISAYAMRDLDAAGLSHTCTEAIAAARIRSGEAMSEKVEQMVGTGLDTPVEEMIPAAYRNMPEVAAMLKGLRK